MRLCVSLVALAITACDIPTDLPRWNSTFAVPIEGTSISVTQLLPSSIELTPDGSAFVVAVAPASFQVRLAQVCAPCGALDGQTVPKPAFTASAPVTLAFPNDVASATITGGFIRFSLTNGWDFDPLRPGTAQFGSLTVRILTPGLTVRGTTVIAGQDRAFPPGTTLTDSVMITPGAAVPSLTVEITLHSPAGDVVRIDARATMAVTVTPLGLVATSATVQVGEKQLTSQPVQINLTGVDDFIIRRVNGGKLVLTINNGFGAGGTMTLRITGPFAPITKTVAVPAGDAVVEVPLTEAELETMLGQAVVVTLSGVVSASSAVAITPAASFSVQPLLVLELVTEG